VPPLKVVENVPDFPSASGPCESIWRSTSLGPFRRCRATREVARAGGQAFGRLLRAVHLSERRPCRPAQRFRTSDSRTLVRLLERSGLSSAWPPVTVRDPLTAQSLVDDFDALLAVRNAVTQILG
jgi:hypothetical protein